MPASTLVPRRLRPVILALALAMSGCTAVQPVPPPDIFDLATPVIAASSTPASRATLEIPEPAAARALEGQAVALRARDGKTAPAGNAQWIDRLPRLVQARLMEGFENTGRFGAVAMPGAIAAPAYRLALDIRAFEGVIGENGARAEIAILATLSDGGGKTLKSREFRTAMPTGTGEGADIAASLGRAFEKTGTELVSWVLEGL